MNKNEAALKVLKNIIGEELYQTVCEQMPGTSLYIPALRGGFTSIAERDAAIRIDCFVGKLDYNQISDKYGLSLSHISKIFQNVEKVEGN